MKKALAFFICTALFVSILISLPAAALADEAQPSPGASPAPAPTDAAPAPVPAASPAPAPTVTSRYALLAGIDATAGIWNKKFSGNARSYILTLGGTEKTVTITPQKGDASQTITIGGRRVSSVTVSVDNGRHKHVTIRVRQAHKRNKVYYIKIVRVKSSDNSLAALSVSAGTLGSEFNPEQLEYTAALDCYTPFITVTAVKAEPHATLCIDGSRRISRKYSLAPGAEKTVKITVRSQTKAAKTYLVHIKREAYPITDQAAAFIDFAKHYQGTRYVKGGKSPAGFDCSGFVYYCLNGIGVNTGYRTSASWARSGYKTIPALEQMLPGDILCFRGHVGIYMGGNMMIDCAYSAGGVRIASCVSPYWSENFKFGKRVLKQGS